MSWKQPIPSVTELSKIFGKDYRSQLLFKELVWRACNTDGATAQLEIRKTSGVCVKTVTLNRGQVLYGRHKFREYLSMSCDKTVDRTLEKLQNTYELVFLSRSNNFTVVTILDYEDVIGMSKRESTQLPSDGATNDQEVTTSKNVESEESVNKYTGGWKKRWGNTSAHKTLPYKDKSNFKPRRRGAVLYEDVI